MKFHSLLALLMMITNFLAGFGATPSKPDFAYPETVSKNSLKSLKSAIKRKDGPAIVRATMNYGLAQSKINPKSTKDFAKIVDEIKQQITDSATIAMLDFVVADATASDSLALCTLNKYTQVLRKKKATDWDEVINVDSKFVPSLYDFAILAFESLVSNDSVRSEAIAYHANNPYPRIFMELSVAPDFDSILGVCNRFKGLDVEAYALSTLAERAATIRQRTLAYDMCCNSNSTLTDLIAQAKAYLTRSDVIIAGPEVVKPNSPFNVKIKATCVNEVKITIEPTKHEIIVPISGNGVFYVEKDIELTLPDYGIYKISPSFSGDNSKENPNNFEVIVTDFLLTQQTYGGTAKSFALDATTGAPQNDVNISIDNHYITGRRGADKYTPRVYNYSSYEVEERVDTDANIFTDRAIYRPGDKLQFAATLFKTKKDKRELNANAKATVLLYNANYVLVDSLSITSDSFGRISGEFSIPKDGLTGYYNIDIVGHNAMSILVSEYKAPTFEVEMSARRIDSTTVEINGKAIGYNGFPISDANVAIEIAKLPQWIWFRNFRNVKRNTITTQTVTTLPDGTFSTKINVADDANLTASAIVTSPTGESHDAVCFMPTKPYFIQANIPTYVIGGKAPQISVIDSEGNPTNRPYSISLTTSTQKIIEPNDDWSNVPSGTYTARITAEDAADFTSETFYVYRTSDAMPPTETALFVPKKTVESGSRLMAGTSYADSHILYCLWTPQQIIEEKWLTPKQGNFFIDINLPDSIKDAKITLFTLHDYEFSTEIVDVTRSDIAKSLNISIESMRNNITPGDKETWTIKVTDNLGAPAEAAVILDLYSKALDAIRPHRLQLYLPLLNGNNLDFNHAWLRQLRAYTRNNVPIPDTLDDISVSFETYNQYWPRMNAYSYRKLGGVMYSANSPIMAEECYMDCAGADIETEEVSITADAGIEEDTTAQTEELRMPELPVALWAPVLTTDSAGSLQIQFTAPNAVTTWAVKALAYNSSLLSGFYDAEIVSSKPVMVQPNLPRFMREGDQIQLRSSIINNTDERGNIAACFELFNPTTDTVIYKKEFSLSIDAMSSEVISIDITAPSNSMLGVRVKASSGNFTDGEQSILPILPNEISMTSARPIFLDADSANTIIEIPKGGVMTFTGNAVWECVTSLPGLQSSASKSAFSAVSALFSAATARGLLRQHPAMAKALHQWQQDDSVLMSQLTTNEDLKIALLSSTPFVSAAQSDTEQRTQLRLLFDKTESGKVIADATHNLAKLVKNGGLAWTENSSEPSFWVTLRVMTTLAQLKRIGYLPQSDRLNQLIANAVKYLDNEVARQFAQDNKTIFVDYVLMRSQFSDTRQTAPAKRAAAATVQHLVGNWREESLAGIAKAAIILNENNYPTTAHKLIESLRQHKVWEYAEICPYFLEAFAAVEPQKPEVDIIRSAYISRKQSMDWGSGIAASDLIAAILNSGAPWLIPAPNELSISVNGEQLNTDSNNIMGKYRLTLPNGGIVEINKGKYPAWGGIFTRSNDSIKAIHAFGTEELKIIRSIEGEMKIGSKITLTLTIDADRELDYVVVRQPRCAAFEPVDQLPFTLWLGYLTAYREPCATETNWFFNRIAKGQTVITESYYITAKGTFALAPAKIQSQYAPEFKANSEGKDITVSE